MLCWFLPYNVNEPRVCTHTLPPSWASLPPSSPSRPSVVGALGWAPRVTQHLSVSCVVCVSVSMLVSPPVPPSPVHQTCPHVCSLRLCLYRDDHSVVADSLWPSGRQPARLLCPWDSPARILEWVAISFSGGSSPPGDGALSPALGRLFTVWATREALCRYRCPADRLVSTIF